METAFKKPPSFGDSQKLLNFFVVRFRSGFKILVLGFPALWRAICNRYQAIFAGAFGCAHTKLW